MGVRIIRQFEWRCNFCNVIQLESEGECPPGWNAFEWSGDMYHACQTDTELALHDLMSDRND